MYPRLREPSRTRVVPQGNTWKASIGRPSYVVSLGPTTPKEFLKRCRAGLVFLGGAVEPVGSSFRFR